MASDSDLLEALGCALGCIDITLESIEDALKKSHFVELGSHWINPDHVVSVVDTQGTTYAECRCSVTLINSRTLDLEMAPKDAVAIIEKGRHGR